MTLFIYSLLAAALPAGCAVDKPDYKVLQYRENGWVICKYSRDAEGILMFMGNESDVQEGAQCPRF